MTVKGFFLPGKMCGDGIEQLNRFGLVSGALVKGAPRQGTFAHEN